MAHILTNAGETHIGELPTPSTYAFDTLILTRGNDVPTLSDDYSSTSSQITGSDTVMASGYPVQGDTSPGNGGGGATIWTWKFEVAAGFAGFVASNIFVSEPNPTGTDPLMMHGLLDTPLEKLTAERLVVFINIDETDVAGDNPTVYSYTDVPGQVPRRHTYTDRAKGLAMWFAQGSTREMAYAERGSHVTLLALLLDQDGVDVVPSTVQLVTRTARRQGYDGRWTDYETTNLSTGPVLSSRELGDIRWPYQGGYNFVDSWQVPESVKETAYELVYTIRKFDGTLQRVRVLIRTGPEAPAVTL